MGIGQRTTQHLGNPEIEPASLPAAEAVEWHSLDPRLIRRLQAGALIRTLIWGAIGAAAHVAVASGFASIVIRFLPWLLPTAWTLYGLLSLRALLWPIVAVPRRGYAIREKDILYRSGVFWRSAWAVPFNRVQHTQIGSTPLDRRFGLASLSVFPAGGGAKAIPGLGEALAERLRAYISARIEGEDGAVAAARVEGAQPGETSVAPGDEEQAAAAAGADEATDPTGDDPS